MVLDILEILFTAAIAIITIVKNVDKTDKKKITKWGKLIVCLTFLILFLNLFNKYDTYCQEKILKPEDIYVEIEIVSNSKEKMDKIVSLLPEKIYARNSKIGNDNLQIDFEKEAPFEGRARSFSSQHLYYKKINVKFDELRLDSYKVDQLPGKKLEINIPEFKKIYSDSLANYIKFNLNIRNQMISGFIDTDGKITADLGKIE